MNDDLPDPLPREEVVRAVERKGPRRIPLVQAKWWGEGLVEEYGDRLREFDRYPDDVVFLWMDPFVPGEMGLSWRWRTDGAHDARRVLDDWSRLDEFIAKLPDPERDPRIEPLVERAVAARDRNRYVLFAWWNLFFERPWSLRGMENLLVDYYEFPARVHELHDALCRLYEGWIRRAARLLRPDGFWTSDDLGHQTQSMISPAIFREFLLPYYRRIGRTLRECGMHFWLHSCGNNSELMDDLIDAGVDVFHPVQKHTMDERETAERFGGRISFLAGIDVQHVLQERDPEGVRAEVRFLIDTFDRPEGGMGLAAGNGIVAGTPLENIRAFLDEAVRYGAEHRRRFAG